MEFIVLLIVEVMMTRMSRLGNRELVFFLLYVGNCETSRVGGHVLLINRVVVKRLTIRGLQHVVVFF